MPGRRLLFDLRSRNETICRSCLLNFRQAGASAQAQHAWTAPFSTTAAQHGGRMRPKARTQIRPTKSAFQKPTEAELMEKLQQLLPPGAEGQNIHSDNFSVNFFEQEGHKLTDLGSQGQYDANMDGMDALHIKDTMEGVRGFLRNREEMDVFDEMIGTLGSSWRDMKSVDDIDKVLEKLDEYEKSTDREVEEMLEKLPEHMREEALYDLGPGLPDSMVEKLVDKMPKHARLSHIPLHSYTANQRKKISRLNSTLQRIWHEHQVDRLTKKHVSSLYKTYHAARKSLGQSWGSIPLDVWDFVWNIFAAKESINPHRLAHVSLLATDMAQAKVALSPSQQLLIVEAGFAEGFEAKAQENWKRCMPSLGDPSAETFKEFWELGVKMYTRLGDMDQAQRAVDKLLSNNSDPRILLPIIRARCEAGNTEDYEKAWNAYRQMRELLGQNMKLKDYDEVVSCFLTTGQTENALYAFVDMMSDGQIDLKKQKYMPTSIANKFFLGKWLKRLIGANDLDGAHSVVEFMGQKGVQASPVHLNGLIGAWQRSGGAINMQKADDLAWKMIQSRIDFVRARRAGTVDSKPRKGPAEPPRATLETFSILAENYRRRDLHGRMDELWDASRDAEISPDAFMMNQLLESYVQANQIKEAKGLYESLVTEKSVAPDPYTFSTLWKTLDVNRLHNISSGALAKDTYTARQLFAETASHRDVFPDSIMDGQLARKILHSFRRLNDNAGFIVALTALSKLFKFTPTEVMVLEMVIGTTRLSWEAPASRRRLMEAKRELDKDLLEWAGEDLDKLMGEKRQEALYEYLQRKFWPVEEDRGRLFTEVSKEMGVYDALTKPNKAGKKGKTKA